MGKHTFQEHKLDFTENKLSQVCVNEKINNVTANCFGVKIIRPVIVLHIVTS
jgi:hypothetical protein